MSDDLVSRLKSPEVFISIGGMTSLVAHEAADHIEAQAAEITRLRARVAELEEALDDLLRCTEKHVFGDECKAQRDKARAALEGGKDE